MGLFKKSAKAPPPVSNIAAKPAASSMSAPDLQETLFNMKYTAKSMGRLATKAHNQIDVEKKKCKKAIEQGNQEGAKIHAENAVRNQKQELNYMKLQSRLDAVVSKLEAHTKMMTVTASMGDVSSKLNDALGTMDVTKISNVMDTFEKQFENLDLNAKYMDGAIADSVASTTPQNEVNMLLQQVGEEHNLEVGGIIGAQTIPGIKAANPAAEGSAYDDLEERMKKL